MKYNVILEIGRDRDYLGESETIEGANLIKDKAISEGGKGEDEASIVIEREISRTNFKCMAAKFYT